MAGKSLVIVESPTKAKTITKFLGNNYVVKASNGHIRDLPNSASEIPPNIKKEAWTKLGINVDNKFEPLYIIPPRKKDNVKVLKDALKGATELLLATDEDREGESISWHIVETLNPKIPYRRLVFHEITKEAIKEAIENPRDIDQTLVRAQETRRIIDRLFGYTVSPVLWKKIAPGLSAGRVQSVAIRLLVSRERERMAFHGASYWGVTANCASTGDTPAPFDAELTHLESRRLATSKDFDPKTGKLLEQRAEGGREEVILLQQGPAQQLERELQGKPARVVSVEEKPYVTRPSAPFVTSTLQQEGNRKLRFSAKRTMTIAQQLYENGFITYMRTDSTTLSKEALAGARKVIERDFGPEFLLPGPREYATKVKNAQEAHEAIRPAGENFAPPETVRAQLGDEAFRLYDLIWKRTLASQMPDARGTHIVVQLEASTSSGTARFRATGKTIEFPGFLRAYVEGSDDPDAELADQERVLPKLAQGDSVQVATAKAAEHTTQPPPRFTEGSLIKELERLGIGRPSTWATVVELVLGRSYAFKKGTALVPTFVAFGVVNLLEQHFSLLLDYDFTARLEDDLDAISRGEAENISYLSNFYFGNGHPGLKNLVSSGEKDIDPRKINGFALGKDAENRDVEVRIGRYGPFVSDGTNRASVPDMMAPDELTLEVARQLLDTAAKGPASLGQHPESQLPVYLKAGRFGPYIQLGDATDGEKPKMVSLLPGMSPDAVTFEIALKLLQLPRTLGMHPETNQPIVAALGRFGPYIKCADDSRSVPSDGPNILELTLENAVELLKQPKAQRRGGKPAKLRDLGPHPISTLALSVLSGRYGPYVTDGTTNASLPKGMDPQKITMDDAVNLLDARAARIAAEGPKPGKRTKKAAKPKVESSENGEAAPAKSKKSSGKKSSRSAKGKSGSGDADAAQS